MPAELSRSQSGILAFKDWSIHWPWVCFTKVGDDIAKATGDRKGLRISVNLTVQNRQAQTEAVPSASALTTRALKEPLRGRKK